MNITEIKRSLQREYPDQRLEISRFLSKLQQRTSPKPVYLWCCFEGWFKLGPFDRIYHDAVKNSFIDHKGLEIARFEDNQWKVNHPKYKNYSISTMMISTERTHPHKYIGGIPEHQSTD